MRRKRKKEPDLLVTLREAILRVLADDKSTPAERLRAIEVGAKIAAIERKHDGGDSGGFFD